MMNQRKSELMKIRFQNPEYKEHFRQQVIARWQNALYRQNFRDKTSGHPNYHIQPHTEETRLKISTAHKGKHLYPSTEFKPGHTINNGRLSPFAIVCEHGIRGKTNCKICVQKLNKISSKRKRNRNYGITLEQREQMIKNQNNKCAICGIEFDETKNRSVPVTDHIHGTKIARAILCKHCNVALGLFYENTTSLKNAIEYLNKYKMIT